MTKVAAIISVEKALTRPKLQVKLPKWSLLWFLKILPQVACKGEPLKGPSMLTFIQQLWGGHHKTPLILFGLGAWIVTEKLFNTIKSWMEEFAQPKVVSLANFVHDSMVELGDYQGVSLSWNLAKLRDCQMHYQELMTTKIKTALHWGETVLSIVIEQSSRQETWKSIMFPSHFSNSSTFKSIILFNYWFVLFIILKFWCFSTCTSILVIKQLLKLYNWRAEK